MRIEPTTYDVVIISSGLVEGLLARLVASVVSFLTCRHWPIHNLHPYYTRSCLIKAGRSVLLLDQSDVYGSACASFTLAGLQGFSDPAHNPNLAQEPSQGRSEVIDHDLVGASFRLLPVNPPLLPVEPANLVPQPLSSSVGPSRGYILDLAPRASSVLAHHYQTRLQP
jgi:RAB protein geranylgeranyltransferase component A